MATMTTQMPPPSRRHGASFGPVTPALQAQLALEELFPDVKAAADEALAELFPALRLRRRETPTLDAGRR